MIDNMEDNRPMMSSKSIKECKPNYEEIIRRVRDEKVKYVELRDAILKFLNGRAVQDKFAELVGELVTKISSIDFRIAKLIKDQEASEENK